MHPTLYKNTNIMLLLDSYITKISEVYCKQMTEPDNKKVILNEILRCLKMSQDDLLGIIKDLSKDYCGTMDDIDYV